MQTITPSLLFNGNAEEAVNFYVSLFDNASISNTAYYDNDESPFPKGTVLAMNYSLNGQEFCAINGPEASFTMAISLQVNCADQGEIDALWDKLAADGGKPIGCGWITDRFGVTWQVSTKLLGELLQDEDRVKANRVMDAMSNMVKIDMPEIMRAYNEG